MVGRAEELEYLADAIADPNRAGVLVAGNAGVGKTRLVRQAIAQATGSHAEFVTATSSARSLPFGAFARLLPEHLLSVDKVDLLAVIGRQLTARAGGCPAILAVDDMHLLDEFSAALVHYVATAGVATVLMTMRSGEAAPDATHALYRDSIVTRLELQPVSRADFDGLIEAVLGGPTEIVTLDRMWHVTEGNALFARELVGDAISAGTLVLEHDVWRWGGGLGVAPRLRETVAQRLGHLSDDERYLLELLAVGEPLRMSSVARLAPLVSTHDLERRGLIEVDSAPHDAEVRLGHPLFGEALRLDLPRTLLLAINHDLAEDEASKGSEGDALRLALLREAAGEVADVALLTSAALSATRLSDHLLAERLARTSIANGGGFGAQMVLGEALVGQHRFEEAETALTPLVGEESTDTERQLLADMYSTAVGFGLGRLDDALRFIGEVQAGVEDEVVGAIMQGQRAALLTYAARFEEAARLGTDALAGIGDEGARLRSLASVGVSLVMSGRINEALQLSESSFEPALRLQDRLPRAPAWVVSAQVIALFLAGRGEEAIGFLEYAVGAIPNLPPVLVAQANGYMGRFALSLGRVRTASRLLNDAALTVRDYPGSVQPSWCLAVAAEAHALLGEHDKARSAAEESIAFSKDEVLVFRPDELRALAWVDAMDGRHSSALSQFWAAADVAADRSQRSFEILILGDLLRLGDDGAAERALEVSAHVDGAWSGAIGLHARGLLSGQAADLQTAAEAFTSIGTSLTAAELWVGAAAAFRNERLPARAAVAARRARELIDLCEGAHTPPLDWVAVRAPLTRREREIAGLAAQGMTSAVIAGQLGLSVRTVESHLYAAFAKLGITDRDLLSDALGDA